MKRGRIIKGEACEKYLQRHLDKGGWEKEWTVRPWGSRTNGSASSSSSEGSSSSENSSSRENFTYILYVQYVQIEKQGKRYMRPRRSLESTIDSRRSRISSESRSSQWTSF